jgi:hypothetical protein
MHYWKGHTVQCVQDSVDLEVGFFTGNPWVRKRNPHPPRGKPAPLQRVAGFPLSRVRVFTRELQDLAGSRTVRSRGLELRIDV